MQTIEKKSLKVGKYVNTAHVDKVIRNYKQERWVHNSERIGKEDSLSGWWSIEEMEEFIAKAKSHGADGIKFYFGAYDADYAERPEYAGRQTLVMVGTKHNETGVGMLNKDIYYTDASGQSNILAYNATSMCPPYCSGTLGKSSIDDNELGVTLIDKGEDGMILI